jgi:TonB-dependent SusC/RagA subfamily outer membrane receptor
MPGIFDVKTVQEIVVLKDAEAMALYGARASGGAVVITTQAKTFRTKFKDYVINSIT